MAGGSIGYRRNGSAVLGLQVGASSHSVIVVRFRLYFAKQIPRPNALKRKPVIAVLMEASMPTRAPIAPRARLNRPVPAVRFVITITVNTPTIALVDQCGSAMRAPEVGERKRRDQWFDCRGAQGGLGLRFGLFSRCKALERFRRGRCSRNRTAKTGPRNQGSSPSSHPPRQACLGARNAACD